MALRTFTQINEEAKLRQGLPHISTMKHDQFRALLGAHGHIRGHVTEKSDGMAFEVGHDENGFYSRTSRSDKMRHHGDYYEAAKKKFGDDADPKLSGWFGDIHKHLHENPVLHSHLKKTKSSIKGEVFHLKQGEPAGDEHHVRFVGTAYDKRKMGRVGSFIVHSKLPENHKLPIEHVHKLGDDNFKFDHDHVDHEVNVDASDLHHRFHKLNHALLDSRKHADRPAKEIEKGKFDAIKNELHARVAAQTAKIKPRWGPETEGHVIHPHESNPSAPRFKVVDGNFMARKKAGEEKWKAKAPIKESLIAEGGNIHFGDKKTTPITIDKRDSRRHDIHDFLHSVNKHSGGKIFGQHEKALVTGSAYSGSSRHMMDSKIPSHELGKFKKSFGDVDVQVPHDSEHHVVAALQPGQRHGKFTVVGVKKMGAQHSAVVKHDDGEHHQVDFEYKHYDPKTHEPTKYSQWSQNSHINDLKHGIKGVFHKLLVQSATSANSKQGIIQTTKRGVDHHEEGEIRSHVFSPAYGMREKHHPLLDDKGNHVHHEGKPVYGEHKPGSVPFDTDLHSVYHKVFGKKPSKVDIDSLHSFHGTASLIKKHFNHEQQHRVIHSFIHKMYGDKADKRDHDINKDVEAKDHVINKLKTHFREHFDHETNTMLADHKKAYIAKHSKTLTESKTNEKHIHVAMAAGRFTGPTVEHQKLIDNVLKQKTDHHYVFVMGPSSPEKTTAKDPLTVHEKITHLKKLYPNHKHIFVPGTTISTRTPPAAMSWIHHRHRDEADHVHLHVVAGKGEEGVEKNAGGSIDSYKSIFHRLNKTHYPIDDSPVSGQQRMNYKSAHFIGQERGTVSGSKVRRFASEHDPKNDDHVHEFRKLLHTGVSHDHAREIMHQIKSRMPAPKPLHEMDVASHRGRSLAIHQNEIGLQRQRHVQVGKMAPDSTLIRRAHREAINTFRHNLAGLHGKPYSKLSIGEKMWIDKIIEIKAPAIKRLATRLYDSGKTRQHERDRLRSHFHTGKAVKTSPFLKMYHMASEAYDEVMSES